MKVSFLVTYYNQVQYVEESLNSILDIDKPCDWEIVRIKLKCLIGGFIR